MLCGLPTVGNTSWVVGIVNRYCYFYLTKNALHVTDKLVHVPEKKYLRG